MVLQDSLLSCTMSFLVLNHGSRETANLLQGMCQNLHTPSTYALQFPIISNHLCVFQEKCNSLSDNIYNKCISLVDNYVL